MNKETLVNKLDNFLYDYDTYEYKDNENYLGHNKNQIAYLVNQDDFNGIKTYLKEVISESDDYEIQYVASGLIKDINKYQKHKSKDIFRI